MSSLSVFMCLYGLLSLCLHVGCRERKLYNNYVLLRLYPRNQHQMVAVTNFKDPKGQMEVLKASRGYNDSMDVLVPPTRLNFIQNFAKHNKIIFHIKTRNYGKMFKDATSDSKLRKYRHFDVFDYHSHAEIQKYLKKMAKKNPGFVTLENLGHSYEGRNMLLIKISTNPTGCNPIIFVDAGIHAREWVAPAMAVYLIHHLIHDPSARTLELDGVDWYILPVVNPDGYEYTRTPGNRMWRKTRSKNSNCYGVDGNRNFGYMWGVSGISRNPCDNAIYCGPKPFSEPETVIVKNVMERNAERIKLYLSLHSYGNYILYPWGYSAKKLPKEWKKFASVANAVSAAVVRAGGDPFKVMSSGQWYPVSGTSNDYAYGAVGIPYTLTMEITDGYEFLFPKYLLSEVLPEYYEGFKVLAKHIRKEFCFI